MTDRTGVVHRALDGYRYRIFGDLDLSRPFTSVVRYSAGGRLLELTSGSHRAAEGWAGDLGIGAVDDFDDEFSVAGGRLRTTILTRHGGESGVTDRMVAAVWQGKRFSMFVPMYNARPADAVDLFRLIQVTQHEDGLTIASRNPRRAGIAEPAGVAKEIPDVGLLEITALTKTTARQLPKWSGAKVSGGELFRDTLDDAGTYFVLATKTALVTVLPHGRGRPRQTAAGIGRLRVETVAR